jgi:sec-independent protein translocase protein TatA
MATLNEMVAMAGWGMPGTTELIIVGVVALVIFGPKRLPALARSVGKSITDFKRGLHDIKEDIENADEGTDAETEAPQAEKTKNAPKKEEKPRWAE